ncbi:MULTISPECIES: hypothetical protein [unclassified Leucobacter]|uniref:hypothetical protein n=1 Tax=unclassified Leucobacter TaxID=2621730 RepID=UPI0019056993|nr:hypothetical protein [Leucobacter sp. L43]
MHWGVEFDARRSTSGSSAPILGARSGRRLHRLRRVAPGARARRIPLSGRGALMRGRRDTVDRGL